MPTERIAADLDDETSTSIQEVAEQTVGEPTVAVSTGAPPTAMSPAASPMNNGADRTASPTNATSVASSADTDADLGVVRGEADVPMVEAGSTLEAADEATDEATERAGASHGERRLVRPASVRSGAHGLTRPPSRRETATNESPSNGEPRTESSEVELTVPGTVARTLDAPAVVTPPVASEGRPHAVMPTETAEVSDDDVDSTAALMRRQQQPARPLRQLQTRPRPRVRRVTRVVRHVDTWSVFKVALVFSAFVYAVCLTAGVLLWEVAESTGTIDNFENWMLDTGWVTFELKGDQIFDAAWVAGLFLAVGLVGLAVLMATLFNLITDLVGGIRVSVLEEEVVARGERPMSRKALNSYRRAQRQQRRDLRRRTVIAAAPRSSTDDDAPTDATITGQAATGDAAPTGDRPPATETDSLVSESSGPPADTASEPSVESTSDPARLPG
jgi:hypothetical protein